MEAFILKTLKKIRKEVPRRLKELRSVSDELIGTSRPGMSRMRSNVICNAEVLSAKSPEALAEDGSADKYFNILDAACESRNIRLMEIGLDAIHYLIGTLLIIAGITSY